MQLHQLFSDLVFIYLAKFLTYQVVYNVLRVDIKVLKLGKF